MDYWLLARSTILSNLTLTTIPLTFGGWFLFKNRYKIRDWWIKKRHPKHCIMAIFLNKERCISILAQVVKDQTNFTYEKEQYNITKEAIFHQYHGKRWFWEKQSTGMPYSIYIDGNPNPITAKELMNKKMKYDAKIVHDLAGQTFIKQLLTDTQTSKMLQMLLLICLIGFAIMCIKFFILDKGVVT